VQRESERERPSHETEEERRCREDEERHNEELVEAHLRQEEGVGKAMVREHEEDLHRQEDDD
jgi:hypothetical protein